MKLIIKYGLVLTALFVVGALFMGLFNPGITIKVEKNLSASIPMTWDVYTDLETWHHWRWIDEERLVGPPSIFVHEGQHWSYETPQGRKEERVVAMVKDSLLIIETMEEGLRCLTEMTMQFDNGKTLVKERLSYTIDGFLENVKLNFRRSDLEKKEETRLDSLKQWVEVGEKR